MSAPRVDTPEEPQGAHPELGAPEVSGAAEIVRFFVQSLKTHRIHGVQSAAAVTSVERLHRRLATFCAEHALVSVSFSVTTDALSYKGHRVLDLTQTTEPAFASMVRSGIRQLGFLDAISEDSLRELIQLMVDCPADSVDFDLATLLWERDFDQVQYLVVESFAEDLASPEFQHELDGLLSAVASEVPVDTVRAARLSEDDLKIKAGQAHESSRPAEDVFDSVFEEERVAEILARGTDEHLVGRLVSMVLRLVHETPQPDERTRFAERLVCFLEEELQRTPVESLTRALRLLHDGAHRAPNTPAGTAARLVLERLATSPALGQRVEKLALSPQDIKSLALLFTMLGPATLPLAYAATLRVNPAPAAGPLVQALSSLSASDPRFLIRQLAGRTPEAERLCIPALAPLQDRAAGSALVEAFRHGSTRTRIHILRCLASRREPFVRSLLINALSAKDADLRLWGFRLLARFQDRGPDRIASDALLDAAVQVIASGEGGPALLDEAVQAMLVMDFPRAVQRLTALAGQSPGLAQEAQLSVVQRLRELHRPAVLPVLQRLSSQSGFPDVVAGCEAAIEEFLHAR